MKLPITAPVARKGMITTFGQQLSVVQQTDKGILECSHFCARKTELLEILFELG